jgi:mannitol/fructose-specific phosphotransferase system IIA component (Ntr-type)
LFDNEQLSDVSKSREYEAVTNYFPDISDTEKKYLTCQLLGTRLKEYLFQSESGRNQSYHSANELVICFEKLTRVYVEDRNDLITDLASHISESVYRHKYGMMFQEQMSKPIRRRHKELFSTIRLIVNDLHGDIGYPMNDDETARLTIIFFNHLQQMTFKSEHVPTILIVAQKTKQNETLPNKIMNDFPMLQIQKVYTVQEFEKSQDIGEFLISTLPLHTDSIYALIDENLDEVSRNIITRTCAKYRFGRSLEDIEEFMQKIEPCIKRDKYIQVKAELVSFLFGRVYTLCDILLPEYVQTRLPANHWEDAIRAAANPILAKRAINGDYVNDIIASISAYGSYSFISKDVYLAHAEINGNVNQLSLGISTFSNPIIFPDGKQARMIFILCPIDKSSHFDSFKEIIRICGQKGVIESMIHADSPDALMNIVLKKL